MPYLWPRPQPAKAKLRWRARLWRCGHWAVICALVGLSACSEEATPRGQIEVAYDFEGSEAPTRVDLFLVARERGRCHDLGTQPSSLATSERDLNPEGTLTLADIPEGEWTLLAVGYQDGIPVARDCDEFKLTGATVKDVHLLLQNVPVNMRANYESLWNLSLGSREDIAERLRDISSLCPLLGGPPEPVGCQLVAPLAQVLQNMRLRVIWEMDSGSGSYVGRMRIDQIDNLDVPESYAMTVGDFGGHSTGSTEVEITANSLRFKVDVLVHFVLEQMLKPDLSSLEMSLDELLGLFAGDIRFQQGRIKVFSVGDDDKALNLRMQMAGRLNSSLFGNREMPIDLDAVRDFSRRAPAE